jgi:hypothetical protein
LVHKNARKNDFFFETNALNEVRRKQQPENAIDIQAIIVGTKLVC